MERTDLGALVAEVCGFGPAVLALEPPELVKSLFYHQLGLTIATPTDEPSSFGFTT